MRRDAVGAARIQHFLRSLTAYAATAIAIGALVVPAAALGLPSGRSYQMVSAPEKSGDGVGAGFFNAGGRASTDGKAFIYGVPAGFGDAEYSGIYNTLLATRTPEGWSSDSQTPFQQPIFIGPTGPLVRAVSADLTKQVWETTTNPNTGARLPERAGLWLHDSVAGTWQEITPDPEPGGAGYPAIFEIPAEVTGALPDLDVLLFETVAELTPDAVALDDSSIKLYRWQGGNLTMVGQTPPPDEIGPGGEEPVSASLGGPEQGEAVRRAVAADGAVVYFSRTTGNRALYRRDGSGSYLVNQDENPNQAIEPGPVSFYGASADGSRAFFLSSDELVTESPIFANRLYMYRHGPDPAAEANLSILSEDLEPADAPGGVQGVVAVSDDGHRVFFVAGSQFVPGAPLGPGPHLYLWDDSSGTPVVKWVATGSSLINLTNLQSGRDRRAITPDGDYLFFLAQDEGITPEPTNGVLQAFRYDAAASAPAEPVLTCVSCGPAGAGSTEVRTAGQANVLDFPLQAQRWASGDGRRAVFDTDSPLLGSDTNGKSDVYLWEEGVGLQLATTGRSGSDSFFLDADATLDNVFVQTKEPLSGWDIDEARDVYNVTTEGAFPEPPDPPPGCQGEDCRGPAASSPTPPVTATSRFQGPGDRKPRAKRRCSKRAHKVERKGQKTNKQQRKAAKGCKKGRRS